MKKFILVLLSVLLALSFFSCENDTQPSSSDVGVNIKDIELLGVLNNIEWESADEIGTNMFWWLYNSYVCANTTYEERVEKYTVNLKDGWFYPAKEMEAYIQKYFDVSVEKMRSDTLVYHEEYNAYNVGGGNNLTPKITFASSDVTENGDIYTVTAKLDYMAYSEVKVYTLKKDGDCFKYISCVKAK